MPVLKAPNTHDQFTSTENAPEVRSQFVVGHIELVAVPGLDEEVRRDISRYPLEVAGVDREPELVLHRRLTEDSYREHDLPPATFGSAGQGSVRRTADPAAGSALIRLFEQYAIGPAGQLRGRLASPDRIGCPGRTLR